MSSKRRIVGLCAVFGIALACGACTTSPANDAMPTTAPMSIAPAVVSASPPAPTSEPAPIAPPEAEQAFMSLVEGYAPHLSFVDMPSEDVAPYVEALGGDYDVFGRTAGDDASYLVAVRRADAPIPADYRDISVSHVSQGEGERSEMWIQYRDPGGTEHALYRLAGGHSVHPTRETLGWESLCITLFPQQGDPDWEFYSLFTGQGRARLAYYREHPEFLRDETTEPRIAIRMQNERTAKFVSGPTEYHIAIPEDVLPTLTSLLADAKTIAKGKRDTGEYLLVREHAPNAYSLGVAAVLEGKRYHLYGEDGGVGLIALQRGEDAALNAEDDAPRRSIEVQLLRSEEAAEALLAIVKDATGHDVGSFSPRWFDEPLASATLVYPHHGDRDGAYAPGVETQTVTDPEKLESLRHMLAKAVRGPSDFGKCPYVAPLTLTRADGATMMIMIANDSCDSMAVMGAIGFSYGKQEDMRAIFDEVMTSKPKE